jgi:hypothetical protein
MRFETRDSGERQEFPSGMRRDTDAGKPRYDLIDEPMLTRWAELMARGAEKYGQNNWLLANSEEELQRFKASGFRHFIAWIRGDEDEDHGAAVFYNIAAAEYVKRRLNEIRETPPTMD